MGDVEYIEAYLADELSDEARRAFEQRLQTDPAFAAEFALHKDTHQLLVLGKQLAYKERLRALDAETSVSVRPLWWRWQAAAAVLLLLVAAAVLWLWQPGVGPYRAAFSPYPDRLSLRQDGSQAQVQPAMAAYQDRDFERAAARFEVLAEQDTGNTAYQFYWGVSLLGADQAARADAVLGAISPRSLYFQASQWYRALALGQQGRISEAQPILRGIAADSRHPYQEKAQLLLAK